MLILARQKFVLVHNPKTAGMALIHAISGKNYPPNPMSHLFASVMVDRIFQEEWERINSVCFVRNPLDRYRSLYRFHASVEYGIISHNSYSHQIACRYSFADWLSYNLGAEAKAMWFGVPQARWWQGVRHVFRYEDTETAFQAIGGMIGRELQVPRINASRPFDGDLGVTDALLEAVWKIDAETASAFNYEP